MQSERERENERDRSSICWFTPRYALKSQARSKPGDNNCFVISHVGAKGPSVGTIFCCLPGHIIWKLLLKQYSQDGNQLCSMGCDVTSSRWTLLHQNASPFSIMYQADPHWFPFLRDLLVFTQCVHLKTLLPCYHANKHVTLFRCLIPLHYFMCAEHKYFCLVYRMAMSSTVLVEPAY